MDTLTVSGCIEQRNFAVSSGRATLSGTQNAVCTVRFDPLGLTTSLPASMNDVVCRLNTESEQLCAQNPNRLNLKNCYVGITGIQHTLMPLYRVFDSLWMILVTPYNA